MRIFNKSLAVAACVAAVTFGAVALETEGTTHLDWMSDRASSLHSGGCRWHYYEDINHRGRNFESSSDLNYLRGLSHAGLHWGETWDDRISSVYKVNCRW